MAFEGKRKGTDMETLMETSLEELYEMYENCKDDGISFPIDNGMIHVEVRYGN